jgi:hypothetical protein
VSVTFSGVGVHVDLDSEHYFNLANGNARAFLGFLGIDSDELYGELPIPAVRQKIMVARATFDRKVDDFTRPGSDTKRPGQCRVIEGGIDRDYFERRLREFAALVEELAQKGATHISWG